MPVELPLAGGRPERADAARNRAAILAAAGELVARRGISCVSMQDVAEAAGVGAGTLYRRFGDRAGLAVALVDEQTRAFQDALLAGPPPLGPGAPALERMLAFGDAYLASLASTAELLSAGDAARRGPHGPYAFFLTHLAVLLREAAPDADAEWTAQALLAALAPGLVLHLRDELGWPEERIRQGWRGLVERLTA